MTKIVIKAAAVFFSLVLFLYLLISSTLHVGLSYKSYRDVQIKYDISDYAGIDQQTMDNATKMLIDYMDGKRNDINMVGIVLNRETQLFNNKEKMHMADVRILMDMGKTVLKASLIIMVIILLFCMLWNYKDFSTYFFKTSAIALGIFLCFMIIGATLAVLNFTLFWDIFHKVLFTNDLYLLDPRTDLLIRMMPERFFISLTIKVLLRFVISYLISVMFLMVANRAFKRKRGL